MKNSLKIVLVAIFTLASMWVNAKVDSSTQKTFRLHDGMIERIKVHNVQISTSDTIVLESAMYYPKEIDSATALAIMQEGTGSVEKNYSPIWDKNPFWFLFHNPQIKYDSYSYKNEYWQPVVPETKYMSPHLWEMFGFWFMFVILMIINPVIVRCIVYLLRDKYLSLSIFVFSVVSSIVWSYALVPNRSDWNDVYSLHLKDFDVYKHYYILPVILIVLTYIGDRKSTRLNSSH